MYGDYEAQRHWMELTTELPMGEWYRNTTRNDLLYWGLDYPPLTAYWAWATGKMAHHLAPGLVEWEASRGKQGEEAFGAKLFMRLTVLLGDLLVWLPAAALFAWAVASIRTAAALEERAQPSTMAEELVISLLDDNGTSDAESSRGKAKGQRRKQWETTFLVLYVSLAVAGVPYLLIIDHGHFQYNSISLGLALAAIAALLAPFTVTPAIESQGGVSIGERIKGWLVQSSALAASALFCFALNYKQMLLYYSPVFFVALAARCWAGGLRAIFVTSNSAKDGDSDADDHRGPSWLSRLSALAAVAWVVIRVFAAMWLPFCLASVPTGSSSPTPPASIVDASRSVGGFIDSWAGDGCTEGLLHVFRRLFPLDRNVFEDKVSNIWCALEPMLGIRRAMASTNPSAAASVAELRTVVARFCAAATLVLMLPALAALWRATVKAYTPTTSGRKHNNNRKAAATSYAQALLSSLLAVSLSFFLASYQVHEKSILMPAVAATALSAVLLPPSPASSSSDSATGAFMGRVLALFFPEPSVMAAFVTVLASWSMWPLLHKDGLLLQAAALTAMYLLLLCYRKQGSASAPAASVTGKWTALLRHLPLIIITALAAVVSVAAAVVPAPSRLPDLWPYLSSVVGCVALLYCWLWSTALAITTASTTTH